MSAKLPAAAETRRPVAVGDRVVLHAVVRAVHRDECYVQVVADLPRGYHQFWVEAQDVALCPAGE
jgi:hypothetical protein